MGFNSAFKGLMFIGPCVILIVEEWKTNLMSLAIVFHFLCAQHVSDINISIIRSLRLCCWITTSVVLFSVRCVLVIWCGWFWVVFVLQAEACVEKNPYSVKIGRILWGTLREDLCTVCCYRRRKFVITALFSSEMVSGRSYSRGGINFTRTGRRITPILFIMFADRCHRPHWVTGVRRLACPSVTCHMKWLHDVFCRHWRTWLFWLISRRS